MRAAPRQNRILEKHLGVALTGSESGLAHEEPADPLSDDDPDSDDDDGPARPTPVDDDEDAAVIAANEVAGKEFPLSHRLLDPRGFRSNALLESVLTHPHEVCLLLQKDQGVGLSFSWQMMRVLHAGATSTKVQVVSGHTKEGVWKELHAANLPDMFQRFRSILATQLEQRCHVSTTPDEYTLLALAFDPSVDTSADTGIFSKSKAAQELMDGAHRRALARRQQRLAAGRAPAPAPLAVLASPSAAPPPSPNSLARFFGCPAPAPPKPPVH